MTKSSKINPKELKTIFMGSPEEIIPILKKLRELTSLQCIFTASDKTCGRGRKQIIHHVKDFAIENNIDFYQPCTLKNEEAIDIIKKYNPHLILVMSYGYILPKEILDIPTHGAFNIHASILPKYRGASPIQSAILNNDKKTGLTLQKMSEKLDRGDIVAIKEIEIENDDNCMSLKNKICNNAPIILEENIEKLSILPIETKKQNEDEATYCKKIKKEDAKIDWNKNYIDIWCMIRAFSGWPIAFSTFKNKRILIHKTKPISFSDIKNKCNNKINIDNFNYGSIIIQTKKSLIVKCKDGALELLEVQPEN